MSTRCQVWVEGSTAAIYRHSDGYPDTEHGVLASLLPILKRFLKVRGWDTEYLTAHIVSHFIRQYQLYWRRYQCQCRRQKRDYIPNDEQLFLGHGVGGVNPENPEFHGDLAFIYVVRKDGWLEVRKPGEDFWNGDSTLNNTVLVKRRRIYPKTNLVRSCSF